MQKRNSKLLIIDDDFALANMIADALQEDAYQTTTENSVDSALKRLETESFDLILSDIQLPGMHNGWDLLQAIPKNFKQVVVILMTGYSHKNSAILASEKGAYDFIHKPFHLPELKLRLRNALNYQLALRAIATLETERKRLPIANFPNPKQQGIDSYRSQTPKG